jgi:fatty-acyl-CoA synthase
MCYTSGTTGNPKGVVYSHRSNVLHALISCLPGALGLSSLETVLPVVPMFHANAWGIAHSAPMVGARLVMPGNRMDGEGIYELLDGERVTISAAVPTVWMMLLQHLEETGRKLPHLRRVVIGGSACPRAMIRRFEADYGVEVIHAWGMTEMSPLGSLGTLKPVHAALQGDALLDVKAKQGSAPYGVEMKVTDDRNHELPWDGKSFGHLKVRGAAIAASYYGGAGAEHFDPDGWFDTGDVAHIDGHGFMQITDRAKDVIKSGGEWISTIDLENLAVGHPDVAEAAAIGVAHPKWGERPLLVVVPRPGRNPSRADILAYMEGKIARWWLPDDVAFIDEIPHTATGKIQKAALRQRFAGHVFAS